MKKLDRILAFVLAALVLTAGWVPRGVAQATAPQSVAGPSPALSVVADCNTPKTKVKTSNTIQSTTSQTFVTVPDMQLGITISGMAPSCIEVAFSAEARPDPNGRIVVTPVLDTGAIAPQPGAVTFASAQSFGFFNAHSFHWLFKDVPPGSHVVKMVWVSDFGTQVWIGVRSLFVYYK